MKHALQHKTKMSVSYFCKWMELLGCNFEICISDNTNDKYQALIINQMWGGGDLLTGTAVSHSFIELYNLSGNELNLKGLYLWYKSGTSAWEKQELVGIIPPYSSFLVRGAQHNSLFKDDCRLKIEDFDLEFRDSSGNPKKFANNGMSVYISIGDVTPDTNPLRKTTSVEGATTYSLAYVDLMGCGGTNPASDTVSAYETNCLRIVLVEELTSITEVLL